jgi:hypothetical protein
VLIVHTHNSNNFSQVILAENLSSTQMVDAAEAMAKKISPETTAMFMFLGHGFGSGQLLIISYSYIVQIDYGHFYYIESCYLKG